MNDEEYAKREGLSVLSWDEIRDAFDKHPEARARLIFRGIFQSVDAEVGRQREALNIDREDVGRIMHESWTRTKRAQGFHHPTEEHGPGFNKMLGIGKGCDKCHPDLILWEELSEAQKDINRHAFDDVLAKLRRKAKEG